MSSRCSESGESAPTVPARCRASPPGEDEAAAALLRGHLEYRGPSTVAALAEATGLRPGLVAVGAGPARGRGLRAARPLHRAGRGRGVVRPAAAGPHPRLHAAAPPQRDRAGHGRDFMRFLLRWQHVAPGTQPRGPAGRGRRHRAAPGLRAGAPAPGRTRSCSTASTATAASGWTRPACPARSPGPGCRCATATPTRRRAAAGCTRRGPRRSRSRCATTCPGCCWPRAATRSRPSRRPAAPATCWTRCAEHGALFRPDLVTADRPAARPRSRRRCGTAWPAGWSPPTASARSGRCCGAAAGSRLRRAARAAPRRCAARRAARPGAGRCCPPPAAGVDRDELAEAVAEQLAARWGVVFRDLMAQGEPGRAVAGHAVGVPPHGGAGHDPRRPVRGRVQRRAVRAPRRRRRAARRAQAAAAPARPVELSAADPLNLAGIVLPGPRIPSIPSHWVTITDGIITPVGAAGATA